LGGDIYNRLPESLSRVLNEYYPNGGRPRIAPKTSKHNPNFRKDRNKQICHDRTQGIKQKEIAEKYGLCLITIKKILKENGLTEKKEQNKIYEVIAMLKTGYNVTQIKKKTGYSRTWIYEIKRREGL